MLAKKDLLNPSEELRAIYTILLIKIKNIVKTIDKEYKRRPEFTEDVVVGAGIGYFLKIKGVSIDEIIKLIYIPEKNKGSGEAKNCIFYVYNKDIEEKKLRFLKNEVNNLSGVVKSNIEIFLINNFYEKNVEEDFGKIKRSETSKKSITNNKFDEKEMADFKLMLETIAPMMIELLQKKQLYVKDYKRKKSEIVVFARELGLTFNDIIVIIEKQFKQKIPNIEGTSLFDNKIPPQIRLFKLSGLVNKLKERISIKRRTEKKKKSYYKNKK